MFLLVAKLAKKNNSSTFNNLVVILPVFKVDKWPFGDNK